MQNISLKTSNTPKNPREEKNFRDDIHKGRYSSENGCFQRRETAFAGVHNSSELLFYYLLLYYSIVEFRRNYIFHKMKFTALFIFWGTKDSLLFVTMYKLLDIKVEK